MRRILGLFLLLPSTIQARQIAQAPLFDYNVIVVGTLSACMKGERVFLESTPHDTKKYRSEVTVIDEQAHFVLKIPGYSIHGGQYDLNIDGGALRIFIPYDPGPVVIVPTQMLCDL